MDAIAVIEERLRHRWRHVRIEPIRAGNAEDERVRELRPEQRGEADVHAGVVGALDVVEARADIDLRRWREVQIRVPAELPNGVVRFDALVVLVVRGQKIVRHAEQPGEQCVVLPRIARGVYRRSCLVLRRDRIEADNVAVAIRDIVRLNASLRIPEVDVPVLDLHIECGLGAPALLRNDLNDAVGRLRTINRRGGGSLDDLDALDLVRTDVVEASDHAGVLRAVAAIAVRRRPAARPIAHAHAVNVNERIIVEAQARHAADV